MKFRFPFLLFLCLFPKMSFGQIEIADGTRPLVVDETFKISTGESYAALVHIGATFPAGPKDKTFKIMCMRQFDSGSDNPDCARLFPGSGYRIRRLRNNDPNAYPASVGISVEVTYPVNMGGGLAGKKVVYLIVRSG